MFSRVVAVRTKEGKAGQLAKTIRDKILPILESQSGFLDGIVLISDTEPDQILALSFWKSPRDAERYMHDYFPMVNQLISDLLDSAPVSGTFNVDAFFSHNVTAGKEAA